MPNGSRTVRRRERSVSHVPGRPPPPSPRVRRKEGLHSRGEGRQAEAQADDALVSQGPPPPVDTHSAGTPSPLRPGRGSRGTCLRTLTGAALPRVPAGARGKLPFSADHTFRDVWSGKVRPQVCRSTGQGPGSWGKGVRAGWGSLQNRANLRDRGGDSRKRGYPDGPEGPGSEFLTPDWESTGPERRRSGGLRVGSPRSASGRGPGRAPDWERGGEEYRRDRGEGSHPQDGSLRRGSPGSEGEERGRRLGIVRGGEKASTEVAAETEDAYGPRGLLQRKCRRRRHVHPVPGDDRTPPDPQPQRFSSPTSSPVPLAQRGGGMKTLGERDWTETKGVQPHRRRGAGGAAERDPTGVDGARARFRVRTGGPPGARVTSDTGWGADVDLYA